MLKALANQISLSGPFMRFWVLHQQASLPDWGKQKVEHE